MLIAGFALCEIVSAQRLSGDVIATDQGDLVIHPILHSTMALEWDGKIIYMDPYGGVEKYQGLPNPDLVIITDIHGDHFNLTTLDSLDLSQTTMIVPPEVALDMPTKYQDKLRIMKNGEQQEVFGALIKAIPMYNLPETGESRHPKGRGNGYVLTLGGKRIYISGDTEDIPEMRALKNIDVAFVCMNLPFTMTVEQAADAVLEFQPKIVYPFHYRGINGFSDIEKFKKLVNDKNPEIEVRLRDWYK